MTKLRIETTQGIIHFNLFDSQAQKPVKILSRMLKTAIIMESFSIES